MFVQILLFLYSVLKVYIISGLFSVSTIQLYAHCEVHDVLQRFASCSCSQQNLFMEAQIRTVLSCCVQCLGFNGFWGLKHVMAELMMVIHEQDCRMEPALCMQWVLFFYVIHHLLNLFSEFYKCVLHAQIFTYLWKSQLNVTYDAVCIVYQCLTVVTMNISRESDWREC